MRAEKRVFLTLDGLRGIAAIMIVLFHSRAIVGHFYPASAYLSVDLFFALSGCVLEASYRDRLAAGLSTREFMTIRFIRLWPLFALSLPIGLAFAILRMRYGFMDESAWTLGVAMLSGLALLPTPLVSAKTFVMPLNAAGGRWCSNWRSTCSMRASGRGSPIGCCGRSRSSRAWCWRR
jgi:hypothetical protein